MTETPGRVVGGAGAGVPAIDMSPDDDDLMREVSAGHFGRVVILGRPLGIGVVSDIELEFDFMAALQETRDPVVVFRAHDDCRKCLISVVRPVRKGADEAALHTRRLHEDAGSRLPHRGIDLCSNLETGEQAVFPRRRRRVRPLLILGSRLEALRRVFVGDTLRSIEIPRTRTRFAHQNDCPGKVTADRCDVRIKLLLRHIARRHDMHRPAALGTVRRRRPSEHLRIERLVDRRYHVPRVVGVLPARIPPFPRILRGILESPRRHGFERPFAGGFEIRRARQSRPIAISKVVDPLHDARALERLFPKLGSNVDGSLSGDIRRDDRDDEENGQQGPEVLHSWHGVRG
jgi:hypothetical protein